MRASLAVGIDDKGRLGAGLGCEAIRLVLLYAFEVLNLHRVSVRAVAYNARALRAYQKCGFVEEGREREAALVDGKWHDPVIMGILSPEFVRHRNEKGQ
jgi:RimJ/RimL family protein N-acetyltransferase